VTARAAAHSDIFIDPGSDNQLGSESMLNAATLLGVPPTTATGASCASSSN
jgi:hypothetical protein